MEREELLKQCRYYKGEKECPFSDSMDGMFWGYERLWLEWTLSGETRTIEDSLGYYQCIGLTDFQEDDGTPITLKAILHNRYDHWVQGTPEDFKRWYKLDYLKQEERK